MRAGVPVTYSSKITSPTTSGVLVTRVTMLAPGRAAWDHQPVADLNISSAFSAGLVIWPVVAFGWNIFASFALVFVFAFAHKVFAQGATGAPRGSGSGGGGAAAAKLAPKQGTTASAKEEAPKEEPKKDEAKAEKSEGGEENETAVS